MPGGLVDIMLSREKVASQLYVASVTYGNMRISRESRVRFSFPRTEKKLPVVTTIFSMFGKEIYVNSSYIDITLNAAVKICPSIRYNIVFTISNS